MHVKLSKNITSPRWLYIKGAMFVVLGVIAVTLLLIDDFSWSRLALLAIAIWAFCRAYYFAFYVIDHYLAPEERFAGLWDFIRRRSGADE